VIAIKQGGNPTKITSQGAQIPTKIHPKRTHPLAKVTTYNDPSFVWSIRETCFWLKYDVVALDFGVPKCNISVGIVPRSKKWQAG